MCALAGVSVVARFVGEVKERQFSISSIPADIYLLDMTVDMGISEYLYCSEQRIIGFAANGLTYQ